MTKIVLIGVIVLVGIVTFSVLNNNDNPVREGEKVVVSDDYKSISYQIDGRTVDLQNGEATMQTASGTVSTITTTYFGNEITGDLNEDGVLDVAFLLTQQTSGSGTFYYVVAALKTEAGYEGTSAFFLGDRISPQTTEYKEGRIVVNYAVRKENEPMTTPPSVAVSKSFFVVGKDLVEFDE